ncbi:MAG: serine acetyltransferase [Epulopiscium sp. Nele67-Bin004]|nr:MAG: serine acetyltransferase [Epulopiscium sp. Nele67-Bin004]
MKEDIVLIGAGGHAKVIVDIIKETNKYNIVGVCAYNLAKGEKFLNNIYCLGNDEELDKLYKSGVQNAVICVGAIQKIQLRMDIYLSLKKIGFTLPTLIHSSAIISDNTTIGDGTCIMPQAVVNSGTNIGNIAIINTSAVVEHDCNVGDNVHISPRACLCGGVSIRDNTHVGAGAIINQLISIENNVIIGSGAVVISNIQANKKVVGIPAR